MNTFAAVMTGQGVGAISTIQLFGDSAKAIIKKIFKPAGGKTAILKPGKILVGAINDGNETIDQVAVGCEGTGNYAINCHGNPLIVEMIMELLARHGAKLLSAEELLAKTLAVEKAINTIALEAKIAQARAQTVDGTKIIANQIETGLSKKASDWLQNINKISLETIKAEAKRILETSQTAKLIINGCTAIVAGPANTGKSTLLNCLTGRQKAIVTDIKGTTRDWVTGQCQFAGLCVKLIDTAGLDETLTKSTIEKTAQQKSVQMLKKADLVLLVLDNSQTDNQLDDRLLEKIADKLVLSEAEGKVLTVLNKCDLPAKFDVGKLPKMLANTVQISAKLGTGIESLAEKIRQISGIADFDLKQPVCFTSRQENLLKQLENTKSKQQALSIITELLNGQLKCHCEERSDEAI